MSYVITNTICNNKSFYLVFRMGIKLNVKYNLAVIKILKMSSVPRKLIKINKSILIGEVKLRRLIYDSKEPSYYDSDMRKKAFDDIISIYNTEIEKSNVYIQVTGKLFSKVVLM